MALEHETVEEFRAVLGGELIAPSDAAYDQARRVWNGNIDRRPALVARCRGVADVIEAVRFARSQGLIVAVRGGAHNAAGHATCDGGIVIDLSAMKGIRVDPMARRVQAQAGVTWAELDRETQAFGLATTGGTVSNTGIAGLTLGGGFGWLMGKHGLTCDNLISADVVTADGRFLQASATQNEDLFWGLRGGGGNFGIVTSFEYQLHPVGPTVLGGLLLHPLDRAREILHFFAEFHSTLPDEADMFAAMLTTPDGATLAALIPGYNGPVEEGERVLAPVRRFGTPILDTVGPMPYSARQSMLDEGLTPHGVQRYWKSAFAREMSADLINALVEGASAFPTPGSVMAFFHTHGAATRVAPDATAFGLREPLFDMNAIAQWTDPSDSERCIAWVRGVWDKVEPLSAGSAYLNHLAGDDRPEKVRASYGVNYERLALVKAKYDPTNLFRLNANIPPA